MATKQLKKKVMNGSMDQFKFTTLEAPDDVRSVRCSAGDLMDWEAQYGPSWIGACFNQTTGQVTISQSMMGFVVWRCELRNHRTTLDYDAFRVALYRVELDDEGLDSPLDPTASTGG